MKRILLTAVILLTVASTASAQSFLRGIQRQQQMQQRQQQQQLFQQQQLLEMQQQTATQQQMLGEIRNQQFNQPPPVYCPPRPFGSFIDGFNAGRR